MKLKNIIAAIFVFFLIGGQLTDAQKGERETAGKNLQLPTVPEVESVEIGKGNIVNWFTPTSLLEILPRLVPSNRGYRTKMVYQSGTFKLKNGKVIYWRAEDNNFLWIYDRKNERLFAPIASASMAGAQERYFAPDLVRQTRVLKVSALEKRMPPIPLDAWFLKAMGKNPSVTWEAEDCGGGPPNFTGLDNVHRLCVVAEGVITEQLSAIVSIEYRTIVNGKAAGSRLERITICSPGARYGDDPGELKALPKRIAKIKRSLVFVDPTDGAFFIADLGEWEGLRGMSIDTQNGSRGRFPNVWKKGTVTTDCDLFPTQRNFYDGKRWSFETVTVHGTRFKFDGKFEKTRLRENGDTDNEHVLKGHLTKFVKRKITAESDLTFTFDPFRDAP